MMALRNVLLFVFTGLFILNYNLTNMPLFLAGRKLKTVGVAISIGILLSLSTLHANVLLKCRGLEGLSPFRVPDGAVEYLKANPIPGNCFSGDRYGGYLLWKLYPQEKVFIDGRFTIRTPTVFNEYFDVLDNPGKFDSLVLKYGITHVLLPIAGFKRYLPLVRELYIGMRWGVAYIDGSSVLFVDKLKEWTKVIALGNPEEKDRIRADLLRRWERNPWVRSEALMNFGDFTDWQN
jgi:hypothetical protein